MKKTVSILLALIMLLTCFVTAQASEGEQATFGGHTYIRIDRSMTWHDAKAYCENLGGYLATVTSAGEESVINALVANGTKDQYWLGATDEEKEGSWKWITGEDFKYVALQRNFDNAYGKEDFLQVQRNNWGDASFLGFWNDAADDNFTTPGEEGFYSLEHVGFICEIGTSAMPQETNIDMPVIYIIGRTAIVREDGSPIIDESTSFMTNVVKDNAGILVKSIITNNYNQYCDNIYNAIADTYRDYKLSDEGTVTNGSHNRWTWNYDTVPMFQGDIYTYRFEYDARLDPCEIAKDLYNYIQAIKAKTGFDKFNLVSRCLGCSIAAAYLAQYGWKDINTNIMYASAALGYDFVGEMFAGKFKFNADSLSYYVDENVDEQDADIFEDEAILEYVKATVASVEANGTLGLTTEMANKIYAKVADNLVPRVLLATYATCPGYWAMVNDENYEAAKQYIFGDKMNTQYKVLVEKIDNYHYNVMNRLVDNLKQMKKDGVKINIIAKYGFQCPPFIESSRELGDNRIDVTSQSFGATTANTADKLDAVYIAGVTAQGKAKYLSPDFQIDASTCLFPDSTWFIKNNVHNIFYDCFNDYLMAMCRSEKQYTITSDSAFPQYLVFRDGNFTPMNIVNNTTQVHTKTWFGARLRAFIAKIKFLFERLKKLFVR